MKKLLLGLSILITMPAFSADVCEMNERSNGSQGHIEIICTNTTDSFISDNLYNYGENVNFRTERVKLAKVLLEKGYVMNTRNFFIKN